MYARFRGTTGRPQFRLPSHNGLAMLSSSRIRRISSTIIPQTFKSEPSIGYTASTIPLQTRIKTRGFASSIPRAGLRSGGAAEGSIDGSSAGIDTGKGRSARSGEDEDRRHTSPPAVPDATKPSTPKNGSDKPETDNDTTPTTTITRTQTNIPQADDHHPPVRVHGSFRRRSMRRSLQLRRQMATADSERRVNDENGDENEDGGDDGADFGLEGSGKNGGLEKGGSEGGNWKRGPGSARDRTRGRMSVEVPRWFLEGNVTVNERLKEGKDCFGIEQGKKEVQDGEPNSSQVLDESSRATAETEAKALPIADALESSGIQSTASNFATDAKSTSPISGDEATSAQPASPPPPPTPSSSSSSQSSPSSDRPNPSLSNPESWLSALPEKGPRDRILFELTASILGSLNQIPSPSATWSDMAKPHVLLQFPYAGGTKLLTEYVQEASAAAGADVVQVDALDLAELCGPILRMDENANGKSPSSVITTFASDPDLGPSTGIGLGKKAGLVTGMEKLGFETYYQGLAATPSGAGESGMSMEDEGIEEEGEEGEELESADDDNDGITADWMEDWGRRRSAASELGKKRAGVTVMAVPAGMVSDSISRRLQAPDLLTALTRIAGDGGVVGGKSKDGKGGIKNKIDVRLAREERMSKLVDAILDSAQAKRTLSGADKTAESTEKDRDSQPLSLSSSSSATTPAPRTIVFVPDAHRLVSSDVGDKIFTKLVSHVQDRRRKGDQIMVIGTAHPPQWNPKTINPNELVRRLEYIHDTLAFRGMFIPPVKKGESSGDAGAGEEGKRAAEENEMDENEEKEGQEGEEKEAVPGQSFEAEWKRAHRDRNLEINVRLICQVASHIQNPYSAEGKAAANSTSAPTSSPTEMIAEIKKSSIAPLLSDRILSNGEIQTIVFAARGIYPTLLHPDGPAWTAQHLMSTVTALGLTRAAKVKWVKSFFRTREEEAQASALTGTSNASSDQSFAQRLKQISASATRHETNLLPCVIDPSTITTTFANVHAPPETISALESMTSLPLSAPEEFDYGVLASETLTGLLLYGPPGVGKTLLAKAVANQASATVLAVSGSEINDMFVGEGEKNVTAIFSLARKLSPCIVFIDEADAILASRSPSDRSAGSSRSGHREVINQFLKEWDGLSSNTRDSADGKPGKGGSAPPSKKSAGPKRPRQSVFLMVATNRPFDLDDAVLRRLPRRLLIDLPTREDREAILKILLKDEQLGQNVDISELAELTPFYSGSDLKNVCVAAALACVRDRVGAEKKAGAKEQEKTEEGEKTTEDGGGKSGNEDDGNDGPSGRLERLDVRAETKKTTDQPLESATVPLTVTVDPGAESDKLKDGSVLVQKSTESAISGTGNSALSSTSISADSSDSTSPAPALSTSSEATATPPPQPSASLSPECSGTAPPSSSTSGSETTTATTTNTTTTTAPTTAQSASRPTRPKRIITRSHFLRAIDQIPASVSEDMVTLQAIRKFDEQYGEKGTGSKNARGGGGGLAQLIAEAEAEEREARGEGGKKGDKDGKGGDEGEEGKEKKKKKVAGVRERRRKVWGFGDGWDEGENAVRVRKE